MFFVKMFDRNDIPQTLPPELDIRPVRWSHSWRGGPDEATIEIDAKNTRSLLQIFRWLRWDVRITNEFHNLVWWGYVSEADIDFGGTSIRLSLEDMFNRVSVYYNYETVDGTQETAQTDWAEDTASQTEYGIKELIDTLNDSDSTQADAYRDQIIDHNSDPVASVFRGRKVSGTLHCRGWWHTLDWQYYANDAGRIEHTASGGTTVNLGLGVTATDIAFTNDGVIHSIGGDFANFDNGTKITVSGSTSNNGARTLSDVDTRDAETYTATTISAETSDDFKDAARRFSFIEGGDVVQISGFSTGAHNDDHWVRDPGEAHIEVYTSYSSTISNESAGNTVTVKRGNKLTTGTAGTNEQTGATTTVTAHGEEISQKFTNSTGSDWTVDKIGIQVQKVGSPTDDLTVGLYSDSGGSIDTLLDSGTIDDADVGTSLQWIWCDLSNTDTVSNGTAYWIKITRAGSNDPDNFYRIGINESELYDGGELLLWDGSSWNAPATTADLLFRVWGAEDTSVLVDEMFDEGELLWAQDIQDTTSVTDNQYRDGTATAKFEIEKLLDMGDSTGGAVISEVSSERIAKFFSAPATANEDNIIGVLDEDGRLLDKFRTPFDKGRCIVGGWIRLAAIPHDGRYYNLSALFLERCEYNANTDSVSIDTRGKAPVWGN